MAENTNVNNVLHYNYGGAAPTANDCSAIALHMQGGFTSANTALLPTSTILNEIIVQDLASITGAAGNVSPNTPGTVAAIVCSASTAVLQGLTIQPRYRGGHPRIYWPPMPASMLSDPFTWNPTEVTAFQSAFTSFLNHLNGYVAGSTNVTGQVAVSYYDGGQWLENQHGVPKWVPTRRTTPLTYPVLAWPVRARPATQRRRLQLQ
jgi:hypothetical protein